ncbi:MAG: hypothetical protein ACP5U1_10440 [Desulfomonilaceae bacterium]
MSSSHISLITGMLFLSFVCCLAESLAGDLPQGCQPYPQSCCAPVLSPRSPAEPGSCQNFPAQYRQVPAPVEVAPCSPRLVPLTYREEGPVRSIVINAVGLLKATIQLPFKAIEAVIPVNRSKPCAPACAGVPYPCRGNPVQSRVCTCPPISACEFQPAACAPPGPVVAPLPRQAATFGCGPQLPPQLVSEHRLPPVEPNNLLQGIVNIPGAIVRDDRWFGDLFRDTPNGPYSCGQVRP